MNPLQNAVKKLVSLLVSGEIQEITRRGMNGRLTANEIATAISEYPGVLSNPPDEAYDEIQLYDVYDEVTGSRKAEFELWYDDDVSDLTLSMDIRGDQDNTYRVSIDDIHVL